MTLSEVIRFGDKFNYLLIEDVREAIKELIKSLKIRKNVKLVYTNIEDFNDGTLDILRGIFGDKLI